MEEDPVRAEVLTSHGTETGTDSRQGSRDDLSRRDRRTLENDCDDLDRIRNASWRDHPVTSRGSRLDFTSDSCPRRKESGSSKDSSDDRSSLQDVVDTS